jgi:hypothetical protein
VLLDVKGYAVDLDEPPRIRVHAGLRCTSARDGPGGGAASCPAITSAGWVKNPS